MEIRSSWLTAMVVIIIILVVFIVFLLLRDSGAAIQESLDDTVLLLSMEDISHINEELLNTGVVSFPMVVENRPRDCPSTGQDGCIWICDGWVDDPLGGLDDSCASGVWRCSNCGGDVSTVDDDVCRSDSGVTIPCP